MGARVQVLAIVGSLVLLALIVEAVRRRRLREQYALVWLLTGVVLVVLSLWRELLHQLSWLMGIYYPPSALLLVGIGLIILVLLSFSVVVSDLSVKVTVLTQRIAILEWELGRLNEEVPPAARSLGSSPDDGAEQEAIRGSIG